MICSSATVGRIYSLLTCLFTAVNTLAIISPSQALTDSFADPHLVNATNLDSGIDKRFAIVVEYGETDLPSTPCLMNTVELLAQYAERDWLSRVGGRSGIVLPEYPQVEIAVVPATPGTSIEVRLIVWGIWVTIRDFIDGNKFHESEVEIFWDNKLAAYIYFTLPMDFSTTSDNGTLGTDEPLTLLPGSNTTTGGISDTSNSTGVSLNASNEGLFSWQPIFAPTAQILTPTEVFLTVMAGLKNAAPHSASDKVPGPYASAALNVNANVQFFLHKRRAPRPKPPYFQYIHVIEALRLVPAYMLRKKRFAELIFVIEVNGIPVGEGYLEKGHFSPPRFDLGDGFEPTNNISLS